MIREELGEEVRLIKSGNGLFEIAVNGKNIYSKKESGEFPVDTDIINELRKLK